MELEKNMERNETKEKTIRYEEKVFDILMESKDRLPPWIKGFYITKPNSKLDREGADIVVQTSDVGDIYVQVKGKNRCSKRGRNGKKIRRGRSYYAPKNIGYVCCLRRKHNNKTKTDEKILNIFLDEVGKIRYKKLSKEKEM